EEAGGQPRIRKGEHLQLQDEAYRLAANGLLEEALQRYLLALQRLPYESRLHFEIGKLLNRLERPAEAVEYLRRAVDLDPYFVQAQVELGNTLHQSGHFEEGLKELNELARRHPDSWEILSAIGECAMRRRFFEEAADWFRRAVSAAPKMAGPHYKLAQSLAALSRFHEALVHCRIALNFSPGHEAARVFCGELWMTLGNYEMGWREMRSRALAMRPDGVKAWQGDDLSGNTLIIDASYCSKEEVVLLVRFIMDPALSQVEKYLLCEKTLHPLLRSLQGVKLLTPGDSWPNDCVYTDLHAFPYLSNVTVESVPWNGPYLKPPSPLFLESADNREELLFIAAREGSYETVISELHGVNFESQILFQNGEKRLSPESLVMMLSGRRLVITTDSLTAHICGACGLKAVYVSEGQPPWHFGTAGDTSLWYPQLTIMAPGHSYDLKGTVMAAGLGDP
ncbi:MAG: tetratricopeptide repeat protein, partial [Deltaproteobacteria bacterium]|nr:tetratricopeptide repeat protein [Deltaproteobacteria bacterium]